MSLKPRLSVRTLLAIVAACGLGAWLAKAWLFPNRMLGQRFALIGPMDIDRDGRDDRARLAWMIFRNGGTVDYDLPVAGPASGGINARTTWYVVDDYWVPAWSLPAAFREARAKAVKQARLAGIRPMPLIRLLARLNGE
ncbi:MAG: hypothetical protein ACHRXM_33625 [Isosphaerales bacterium]